MKNVTVPEENPNKKVLINFRQLAETLGCSTITAMEIKKSGKIPFIYVRRKCLSSHTCRRSFCTNLFIRKIPTEAIMAMSGHKTEKSFLKYLKISKEEKINIHAAEMKKSKTITAMEIKIPFLYVSRKCLFDLETFLNALKK